MQAEHTQQKLTEVTPRDFYVVLLVYTQIWDSVIFNFVLEPLGLNVQCDIPALSRPIKTARSKLFELPQSEHS